MQETEVVQIASLSPLLLLYCYASSIILLFTTINTSQAKIISTWAALCNTELGFLFHYDSFLDPRICAFFYPRREREMTYWVIEAPTTVTEKIRQYNHESISTNISGFSQ